MIQELDYATNQAYETQDPAELRGMVLSLIAKVRETEERLYDLKEQELAEQEKEANHTLFLQECKTDAAKHILDLWEERARKRGYQDPECEFIIKHNNWQWIMCRGKEQRKVKKEESGEFRNALNNCFGDVASERETILKYWEKAK